jgi:hypothetical protein
MRRLVLQAGQMSDKPKRKPPVDWAGSDDRNLALCGHLTPLHGDRAQTLEAVA